MPTVAIGIKLDSCQATLTLSLDANGFALGWRALSRLDRLQRGPIRERCAFPISLRIETVRLACVFH